MALIHATCIAAGGRAVLMRGPSGSGKSDLALRCLALAPTPLLPDRVELVADDQVLVEVREGRLYGAAPSTILGKIEVRGIGIVSVPTAQLCEIVLVAELLPDGERPERFPDPPKTTTVAGVTLPLIELKALESSAPVKLLMALGKPHPIG